MKLFLTILSLLYYSVIHSQISYSVKTEVNFLHFNGHIVRVDPGPGWKGYNINESGFIINSIHGINVLNHKLFTAIGIGYMNMTGDNGISLFANFETIPCKTRISPLLDLSLGYTHLWNQYENGTGSFLFEPGLGINIKINRFAELYLKTGLYITQQSLLFPYCLGIRF